MARENQETCSCHGEYKVSILKIGGTTKLKTYYMRSVLLHFIYVL